MYVDCRLAYDLQQAILAGEFNRKRFVRPDILIEDQGAVQHCKASYYKCQYYC